MTYIPDSFGIRLYQTENQIASKSSQSIINLFQLVIITILMISLFFQFDELIEIILSLSQSELLSQDLLFIFGLCHQARVKFQLSFGLVATQLIKRGDDVIRDLFKKNKLM